MSSLAALSIVALVPSAHAGTYTWQNPAGGLWSDAGNWDLGVPPSNDPTTALVFNGGSASYGTQDNIPGVFQLNSLTLNTTLNNLIAISASGGSSLQLAGTNPTITVNGTGSASISAAISSGALSSIITGGGAGTLSLTGGLTTNALTLNNAGTVNISTTAASGTSLLLQTGNNTISFLNGTKGTYTGSTFIGVENSSRISAGSTSTFNVQGTGGTAAAIYDNANVSQAQFTTSTLDIGDSLIGPGGNANGVANFSAGASVLVNGTAYVGAETGSTGVVNITGGSILRMKNGAFTGVLEIGGYDGISTAGGHGTVNVINGQVFTDGAVLMYTNGTLNLGGTDAGNATAGSLNTAALRDGVTGSHGQITMANNSLIVITSAGTSNNQVTYSGSITGNGGMTIRAADGAVGAAQIFAGTNTYTGVTIVGSTQTGYTGQMSLRAGAANAFSPNSIIDLEASNATLDNNNLNQTIAGLAGSAGTVTLGTSTLTINNGGGGFAGTITGTGGITKNGIGTETFSGTNTYTGDTNINGGKLVISGNTSAGNMLVNNGGTLAGSGTVGATTVAGGAAIAPGNGNPLNFATLNASSLVIDTGANFVYDLDFAGTTPGVNNDEILLGSALTKVSGASGFSFAFTVENQLLAGPNAVETYTLVNNVSNNATTGIKVSDLSASGIPTGFSGVFVDGGGGFWNGQFRVTSELPEPGSFAFLGLGLAPLGVALRRRMKKSDKPA